MDSAFDYVEDHGLGTNADYGYTGKDGSCKVSSNGKRYRVSEYRDVKEGSESDLLAALD